MLAIIAPLLFGATPPSPPVHCPAPVANCGEVRSGPPLIHTFRLTHSGGTGIVTVTGVETGCGCVRKELSRDALRPGDHADVTVTINTLTQPAGPNTWRAVVRYRLTPDAGPPADCELELTVRATVVREVEVTPPELAFSTTATARQTLAVTDRRPAPLTVTNATSTASFLTAEVRPPSTSNGVRTQQVDVVVSADTPAGDWSEVVTLTTDDPGCPVLRVPVRVTKRAAGAVTVTPAAIDLRFAPGQTTLSGVVQLRAGGRPIRVTDVNSSHPAVTVKHSAVGPVATFRVSVDAAGGKAGRAEVRVSLAEPSGEAVTIPVRWESR